MESKIPVCIIVALAENRVIGQNNKMPWHIPNDLKYFKEMTLGKPVIMGRKTWESLGRPLPNRLNIVISRQEKLTFDGAEVYDNLEKAVARARDWANHNDASEIMVIGGSQVYQQAFSLAKRLYITRVYLMPEGDAFFPMFSLSDWSLNCSVEVDAVDNYPRHVFEQWQYSK
ncbi:UNVERIFIED_CONTAM: hypothetical protein GTU68_039039 [Idotea baltica]|nr:hypothetical protein [Idotea baltica]